ncbi:MAG TPA: hypothetical protein VIX14_05645 [Terriglobales bacterium]
MACGRPTTIAAAFIATFSAKRPSVAMKSTIATEAASAAVRAAATTVTSATVLCECWI